MHMSKKTGIILGYYALSFLLFFLSEKWISEVFIKQLCVAIGVAGITTATFSVLSSVIDKDTTLNFLHKTFPFIKKCMYYGLKNIDLTFPLHDELIQKDFVNSKKMYIVMNDAKAFISNHTALFEQRLSEKNAETNFVLLDYEQRDTMAILTRKNEHDHDPNYYSRKIKDVIIYHLNKYKNENENHSVNLYLNSNYTTMAVVLMDNYAMVSLYRLSVGKGEVLHMVFEKNGKEYENIKRDVEDLCSRRTKTFDWSNVEKLKSAPVC